MNRMFSVDAVHETIFGIQRIGYGDGMADRSPFRIFRTLPIGPDFRAMMVCS